MNENQPVQTLIGSFDTVESASGKTYTYTLVSGDGDNDNDSFAISGNALRTNAVLDYETQSTLSFRVRSTDQFNFSIDEVFTVNVLDVTDESGDNSPPTLSGVPVSANLDEGQTLSFTASAIDADPNPVLTFSLDGEPPGASIDPSTGEFTWITDEDDGPETHVFNVQVTDGIDVVVKPVTVIVREMNTAPVLAGVPTTATVVRGFPFEFTPTASDGDLLNALPNSLTFSVDGSPSAITADPVTGKVEINLPDDMAAGDVISGTIRVTD